MKTLEAAISSVLHEIHDSPNLKSKSRACVKE